MKTTTTTTKNNYRFFIFLAFVLLSCALIISSVWGTSNSLTKTAWEFLIFLPSFLLANAGAIIKSNAGRGMIGFFILYVLIKMYTKNPRLKKEEPEATPTPKQEPQVILIKPVGYPVELPSGIETIEYEPAPLPNEIIKKAKKKGPPQNPYKRDQWREAYSVIKPMKRTNTNEQISAWLIDNQPNLPHSVDSITEILKWGDADFPD